MVAGEIHNLEFVGGCIVLDTNFPVRYNEALKAVTNRINIDNSRSKRFQKNLVRLFHEYPINVLKAMIPVLEQGSWAFPHADAFQAIPEAWQMIQIIENLLDDLSDHELERLFKKGHDNPSQDGCNAFARNAQFQYYAAALCRASQLEIKLDEPDFLLRWTDSELGIAVKRVRKLKSKSQKESALAERLSDAEAQIVRSGKIGVSLVDVTLLLEPKSEWIANWHEEPTRKVLSHLSHLVFTEYKEVFAAIRHPLVQGHVIHVAFPAYVSRFKWGFVESWLPIIPPGGNKVFVWRLLDAIDIGVSKSIEKFEL